MFPLYSPRLDSIEVIRRGKVRRAKLYYLRSRRGKSARIAERVTGYAAKLNQALVKLVARKKKRQKQQTRLRHSRRIMIGGWAFTPAPFCFIVMQPLHGRVMRLKGLVAVI